MRRVILQLFLNKQHVLREIEEIQSKQDSEWDNILLKSKHEEWDRYEHLIDLFFNSIGL